MATDTERHSLWGWAEESPEEKQRAYWAETIQRLAERHERLEGLHRVGKGRWADDQGRLW